MMNPKTNQLNLQEEKQLQELLLLKQKSSQYPQQQQQQQQQQQFYPKQNNVYPDIDSQPGFKAEGFDPNIQEPKDFQVGDNSGGGVEEDNLDDFEQLQKKFDLLSKKK
jgi:acyl-homoserine lactone acylase PvdQ